MVKKICWVKYVAKIYLLAEFQKYCTKNEEMMANFHFFFQNAIPDQCAFQLYWNFDGSMSDFHSMTNLEEIGRNRNPVVRL